MVLTIFNAFLFFKSHCEFNKKRGKGREIASNFSCSFWNYINASTLKDFGNINHACTSYADEVKRLHLQFLLFLKKCVLK